jgi:hypothetical protein
MSLTLRTVPDPVLRQRCAPVRRFDRALSDLTAEMQRLMLAHQGIGLAAPQVGILQRVVVVLIDREPQVIVNPLIDHGRGISHMNLQPAIGRTCAGVRKCGGAEDSSGYAICSWLMAITRKVNSCPGDMGHGRACIHATSAPPHLRTAAPNAPSWFNSVGLRPRTPGSLSMATLATVTRQAKVAMLKAPRQPPPLPGCSARRSPSGGRRSSRRRRRPRLSPAACH